MDFRSAKDGHIIACLRLMASGLKDMAHVELKCAGPLISTSKMLFSVLGGRVTTVTLGFWKHVVLHQFDFSLIGWAIVHRFPGD